MSLLRNELLKLHAKKGTYLFLLLLIGFTGLSLIAAKKWLPAQMEINTPLAFADMNLEGLLSIVVLYGVVIGGKMIAEEFQKGTIKQLLIRPKKRISILLSKYMIAILAVIIVTAFAGFLSLLVGLLTFSGGTGDVGTYVQGMVYQLPRLIFYTTLTFTIGVLVRNAVLPIVITLFILFSEGPILLLLSSYNWAKLVIFFHLYPGMYDSNPMLNKGMKPIFPDFTMSTSLLVVGVYLLICIGLASAVFQKKDVL
ncbi:ABC transporter permease [Ectobacillus antri]|jgi:ABC-2 type transport system permease protein|uniref:ABC transporter permease n=1 Tax=Ectobacillus antri TaxID=2486280 RepID=A0ABT6H5P8_9BACI|nr:ABC transporter permease [Ectobacillus antri]MDG4658392.1 ABC transporter permease [Ectobacillus antri]MDG5753726.1 ABC transporter permease [Ectobacillus antri]